MRHLKLCWIALTLVLSLTAFSTFPAAAATMSTAHATLPHRAASICTPGDYHAVSTAEVYDQGGAGYIGSIQISADGCGWVQATGWSSYGASIVYPLQLIDATFFFGGVVTSATYPRADSWNQTIHIKTNGRCIYAYGAVQVSALGYSGWGSTDCIDGWSY